MANRVKEAAELIKAGNKADGKKILVEVLTADKKNEAAWLWMSLAVDTNDLRRECLEEVLKINPNNQSAQKALSRLPKADPKPVAPISQHAPTSNNNQTYIPTGYDDASNVYAIPSEQSYISSSYSSTANQNRRTMEIPPVPAGEDIEFKFSLVLSHQGSSPLFQKNGCASEKGLELHEDFISYDEILETAVRDYRLVVAIQSNQNFSKKLKRALDVNEGNAFAMDISKFDADELKKHIDKICSRRKAEEHRQELIQEGKGNQFRFEVCPSCHAIIDLTEFEETRHIFCRYCDSIFNQQNKLITDGSIYQVCSQCGMFDRVRGYTEFYFYFLIIFYGWNSSRIYVCDNCADKVFIKTFFINLLFLFGIPASINLKIQTMRDRTPLFRTLATANKLAKNGEHQEAILYYQQLERQFPDHPGLLMNQGIAYLMSGDSNSAIGKFKRALIVCSNYEPVVRLVYQLQNANNQHHGR